MTTKSRVGKTRQRGPRKLTRRNVQPDFPYTMRLPDGRTLCVAIPGRWVTADRNGTPAFLPEGVAFLDRVRALFLPMFDCPPSPGYIARLREGLGLTQQQFGERIGVDKMTVSRWERGAMRPSPEAVKEIEELRKQAVRRGVAIAS